MFNKKSQEEECNRIDLEKIRLRDDRQEVKEVMYCEDCFRELYKNENYYHVEGKDICERCFDEFQQEEKISCERIAGDNYDD